MDPEIEELKRLYVASPSVNDAYQRQMREALRAMNSGLTQTAFGGMAFATAAGGWDTITTNTTNTGGLANAFRGFESITALTPEPDGVPGSHPLERILDGLEKSGPERIEKFL